MSELVDKLFAIHDSLKAGLCPTPSEVQSPLPTASKSRAAPATSTSTSSATRPMRRRCLRALPGGVQVSAKDIEKVKRDGQSRLFWDGVPIDVFLNNLPLHEEVSTAVVWVPIEGREAPVLDCASLVVFKAFFDRTKDWADIEAVAVATPEDIEAAAKTVADLVGEEDEAYKRLASIRSANPA